jgi:hypothetical protein
MAAGQKLLGPEFAGRATLARLLIDSHRCLSIRLPGLWDVERPGPHQVKAKNTKTGAEIEVMAYDGSEFEPGPETLIERAASNLQHEYEWILGKPAQSTMLEPASPVSSAMRWTATWVDANFAQADRTLSLEAFIIEPIPNRIVEFRMDSGGEWRAEVLAVAFETMTVQPTSACAP